MRLFVKTWERDWQWLKVAMVALRKHCSDHVEWDIVVDDGTRSGFQAVLDQVKQATPLLDLLVKVHETKEYWQDSLAISSGYIRQQWIKMNAHRVMKSGYFWNWDSDVIAQRTFTSEDLCVHGKPIHWITQFNSLMGHTEDAAHNARKSIMQEIFGIPDIAFEYMRCMPMPMMAEILNYGERSSYWKKAYHLACKNDQRFSEFNIIGLYSHLYFPDVYEWRNTQNYDLTFSGSWGDKRFIVAQGWSWGGCPKELHDEVMK